jgi:hypothetical protein
MTTDDRVPPKDVAPPEEGVIHPAEELVHLNDDAPTEVGSPDDRNPTPDKRPTDGPI